MVAGLPHLTSLQKLYLRCVQLVWTRPSHGDTGIRRRDAVEGSVERIETEIPVELIERVGCPSILAH